MDPTTVVSFVETLFPKTAPWVAGAVAVSAVLATQIPPPPANPTTLPQKAWFWAYRTVNFVAINFGHARNATDPTVTQGTTHA